MSSLFESRAASASPTASLSVACARSLAKRAMAAR
jgi:hypothetical protein